MYILFTNVSVIVREVFSELAICKFAHTVLRSIYAV